MQEWSGREDALGFSVFVRADIRRYDPPGWSEVVSAVRGCSELRGALRRTAAKLKVASEAVRWAPVRLEVVRLVFEHHGFRREDNAMLVSPSVLRAVLNDVLFATSRDAPLDVDTATELTACFLWQTFDRHRAAQLTLLQAKTALALLSSALPSQLFAFLAAEIADHDGQVSPRRLKPLLEAIRIILQALGEESFTLEFKEGRLNQVEAEEWMKSKMGWATHLARFRTSLHEVWRGPCVVCKQGGLQGQAFLCQRCPWYWVCRRCVLAGRYTRGHRPDHPLKDFVAPPNFVLELIRAGGRMVKSALSRKGSGDKDNCHEPIGLIEVPPVLEAGPTEEPLWSLKMRLRTIVSQITEESRRIQSGSEQWENVTEAGRALEDHGQRLQALGLRLSGLTTEHQITSTPKGPAPRPPEMSPIGGSNTTLEFSTVLHTRTVPAETRAPVTAALDKLQTLLATNTGSLEESFGDNEQLERAAQELESLLGGVIAGIEGNKRP